MVESNLPTPPFLNVEGLPNFRDIGGYPISSSPGRLVRRGIVFRSSEPSKVTEAGVAELQRLKIADVYDLRSRQELAKDKRDGHGREPREWEGARRLFVPVFLDLDYSPEAIALRFRNYASKSSEGFILAYKDILSSASSPDNEAAPYKTILQHLASSTSSPAPILLHCSAGKDRTGVICALILSLCGVDDDVIAHEYSLTDLGLKSRIGEFTRHLLKEPALKDNPMGARRMVGSKKENMVGFLSTIRSSYGSIEKCVLDLKLLTQPEIAQLRKNLTVSASDDEKELDWQSHAKLVEAAQVDSDREAETLLAS